MSSVVFSFAESVLDIVDWEDEDYAKSFCRVVVEVLIDFGRIFLVFVHWRSYSSQLALTGAEEIDSTWFRVIDGSTEEVGGIFEVFERFNFKLMGEEFF